MHHHWCLNCVTLSLRQKCDEIFQRFTDYIIESFTIYGVLKRYCNHLFLFCKCIVNSWSFF